MPFMKASPTPGNYLTVLLLGLVVAGSSFTHAQDSLLLQNGERRVGKIAGITGGNIQLQVPSPAGSGSVTSTVPLTQVKAAAMPLPREYTTALAAWQDGNAANFLATAKPLVDKFLGLPAPWVERLTSLMPAAYLLQNNLPEAEKAIAALESAYPNETTTITINKARLAIAQQNPTEAKSLLQPIADEAAKTKLADSSQSAAFGQAFLLLGQVYEAEGNPSEALGSYLKTTTLFYEDKAAVAQAQLKAEALTKTQKVVVP